MKREAIKIGKWQERENGRIQRGPFAPDRTRVDVTEDVRNNDTGAVTLSVQPVYAGQTPHVHMAEGTAVTDASPELQDMRFTTTSLRLAFIAVDPKGAHPTGDPTVWRNKITIQHTVSPSADGRRVELLARPSAATIRYTTNGAVPRDGEVYSGAFIVTPAMAQGGTEVLVRAIAIDGDIEGTEDFRILVQRPRVTREPPDGPEEIPPTLREFIDETLSADLTLDIRQTSSENFFALAGALREAKANAKVAQMQVGLGQEAFSMRLGSDLLLSGDDLTSVVEAVRNAVAKPTAEVTAYVKAVSFPTGRDLIAFTEKLNIDVGDPRETVSQPQTRTS